MRGRMLLLLIGLIGRKATINVGGVSAACMCIPAYGHTMEMNTRHTLWAIHCEYVHRASSFPKSREFFRNTEISLTNIVSHLISTRP